MIENSLPKMVLSAFFVALCLSPVGLLGCRTEDEDSRAPSNVLNEWPTQMLEASSADELFHICQGLIWSEGPDGALAIESFAKSSESSAFWRPGNLLVHYNPHEKQIWAMPLSAGMPSPVDDELESAIARVVPGSYSKFNFDFPNPESVRIEVGEHPDGALFVVHPMNSQGAFTGIKASISDDAFLGWTLCELRPDQLPD